MPCRAGPAHLRLSPCPRTRPAAGRRPNGSRDRGGLNARRAHLADEGMHRMFSKRVTRRDFLESTSALTGAAMLMPASLSLAADESRAAQQASKPYEVTVIRDVKVPMRDGVKLATDLYVPSRDGRPLDDKLPAVLMRIPYDRTKAFVDHIRFFAERGYLAVTQDCRGRFG